MKNKEIYLESLKTTTTQEGRELATTLARSSVAAIQPDSAICNRLRREYAQGTAPLIASSQVKAKEFQTIAMANKFWK